MISTRKPAVLAFVAALVAALATAGCRDDSTPPDSWKKVSLEGQPPLFEMRRGHPALAELDGLYLGQKSKSAKRALRTYCKHPVRRDTTRMGSEAYFLGCRITDDETINYVRVGFWPKIGERVATLEYKRPNLEPSVVRRRYLETLDAEIDEKLEPRSIQMISSRYHMFADWDEGPEGPTHVVVGFSPHVPKEKTRPADLQ